MEHISFKKGLRIPTKRAGSGFHCVGKNKYILIGGANRSEEFGDIWELSFTEANEAVWEPIEIPLSSYTPRSGQASAQVSPTDIFIYGGQTFTQNKHYNDFLHLNLAIPSITKLNKSKSISLNEPSERNSSTFIYNNVDKQLLLFGGADSEEPLKDLFIYDLTTKQWRRQATSGCESEIKGIEMHTAHFYETGSELKKKTKSKNKKSSTSNATNSTKPTGQTIIDINIGDFTKERDSSGVPKPHENVMKLAKVNIEFDESNAVIIDDDNEGMEDGDLPPPPPPPQHEGEDAVVTTATNTEGIIEESKNQAEESDPLDEIDQTDSKETPRVKYMIVLGGRYLETVKRDVFALNLTTFEWRKIKELPFPICAHASAIVEDSLYVYGGTSGIEFFDRIFILQLTNQKLYEVELSDAERKASQIKQRMATAMTYDPDTKNLVLFGGSAIEDESTWLATINTKKINNSNKVKKI